MEVTITYIGSFERTIGFFSVGMDGSQTEIILRHWKIVSKGKMIFFPRFDLPFDINTGVRNYQLVWVVLQYQKPVALFSGKLSDNHKMYTSTEK